MCSLMSMAEDGPARPVLCDWASPVASTWSTSETRSSFARPGSLRAIRAPSNAKSTAAKRPASVFSSRNADRLIYRTGREEDVSRKRGILFLVYMRQALSYNLQRQRGLSSNILKFPHLCCERRVLMGTHAGVRLTSLPRGASSFFIAGK